MNQKLKLVIFSDLHYLDNQHEEENNSKLTKLALPILEALTDKINNQIKPDACIYLGDLIEDTNNYKQDIKNIKYILNKLNKIKVPLYIVLGNHDLRTIPKEELENILGYSSFSVNIKGFHLILLNLDTKNHLGTGEGGITKTRYISEEDLKWLENDLKGNNLPCLIFNHYGIAEDNMEGNYWFSHDKEQALLANRKELKRILKTNKNIIGIFSGHQHWTKRIKEDGLDYYVVGSIAENINNDGIPDGLYLEVEINENKMKVKEKHLNL